MMQAPHTHQPTTIMGFNHINNKADHNINRPKYLTTESPQNIWELGKTPINKSVLKKKYLVNYPNRSVANTVLSGFSVGFRLHYSSPRTHLECSNLVLAHQHPQETITKKNSEAKLAYSLKDI